MGEVDSEGRVLPKPRGERLGHDEIQQWGQGAALPHSRMPDAWRGVHFIDVGGGPGVMEQQASEVDHA